MYALKYFLMTAMLLAFAIQAQASVDCSKIFEAEKLPGLETLEACRDFTERQSRRFERPVFQTQLEQDLIERLIYVVSKKETCFYARESFFSDYGIRNRDEPTKDMGEELKLFWQALQKACPEI